MVRKIEIMIKNTEFRLFLFSSLSQSKNKIKAKFTRVKSAFSIRLKKTFANFSIQKAYKPLNTFSSNYVKVKKTLKEG